MGIRKAVNFHYPTVNNAMIEEHYLAILFIIKDPEPCVAAQRLVTYTNEEMEAISRLPRKEYLLDTYQTRSAFLGLVDILYAYCYEIRFDYSNYY